MQVPPGTYHAYFAGSPDVFAAKFHAEGVDLSLFDTPIFVISPTHLVLQEIRDAVPSDTPLALSKRRP